ncbi:MAG TPA: DUF3617 family protein [Candidatus Binataceae bacterium]|nr:DUF3617 family protein [Candidatus Binataceae bacterium]
MKKSKISAGAVAVMFAAGTIASGASAEDLKAGRWEFTAQVTSLVNHLAPREITPPSGVGLDGGGAGGTHILCITPQRMIPQPASTHHCTFDRFEHTGGTVIWATTCTTADSQTKISGKAVYNGTKMAGTMVIHGSGKGGYSLDMTQRITGKYLGPCY